MVSPSEMAEKQRRVNALLDRTGSDALLLTGTDNFAWFTCGGSSYVNQAAESGVGALLIHRDRKTLITNNVERGRLLDEEMDGQGFIEEAPRWTEDAVDAIVARVAPGQKIISDLPSSIATSLPNEVVALRRSLTPEEVTRYCALGRDVGEAIGEACMLIEPGVTEYEVAATLANEHYVRGIVPIVVLIAADARLRQYRHPLPTMNQVTRIVMLVVCGRRHGMIVSATRLVHFGQMEDELLRKHKAVTAVDAAFIAATKPGARIGKVFKTGLEAYRAEGFPDEWKLHHQGGPTGYAARDYRATADVKEVVAPYQAFAWNPSITGTKSEDTIIAAPEGPEIISLSPSFPTLEVEIGGRKLRRSEILVR